MVLLLLWSYLDPRFRPLLLKCFVTQCNQTSLVFCFVPQTAGEKMSRCKTLLAVNIFRGKVLGVKSFLPKKKCKAFHV